MAGGEKYIVVASSSRGRKIYRDGKQVELVLKQETIRWKGTPVVYKY